MTHDGVRRYPTGAELMSDREVSVRVWAPAHASVSLRMDGACTPMRAEGNGYWSARVAAGAGSRYGFQFPGDDRVYADPASRSQPDGPEGASEAVDLGAYRWSDASWGGIELAGQVLYELHVGTFTAAGTWRAAEAELARLRDTGITAVQMMPIAEFAGAFGWGYDGVLWFAPAHIYGTPADLQHFVDTAHQCGLAVVLDVVYNHVGPSGNVLDRFSPHYFTTRYGNEWGQALNFDGEDAGPVRELVLSNIAYWIREFHVDGFRLDAAQQIFDASADHILAAIARTAREIAAPKPVVVLAEHEPQHAHLMRPADRGYGLDGIYNEDFHHSVRVALTGVRESYLSDYAGSAAEWLSALQWGFLFQGQYYPWQRNVRGAPALDRDAAQFVCFIENHDQVANTTTAKRLIDLTSPAWWRAMSALLLLGPWTPLLFQGQEWGARRPFRFFADHRPDLQIQVHHGRRLFLSQYTRQWRLTGPAASDAIGRDAFEESRLGAPAGSGAQGIQRMYRDLLALRRNDPGLGQHASRIAGATAGDRTLIVRFLGADPAADRLMVVNLAPDLNLAPLPQPLIAPPAGFEWSLLWCSQDLPVRRQRRGRPHAAGRGDGHRARHDRLPPGASLAMTTRALLQLKKRIAASTIADAPMEWLVTNGLGGYASGCVEGPPRRRFHGLLIAAHPAPVGRLMLLHAMDETVELGGEPGPPPCG